MFVLMLIKADDLPVPQICLNPDAVGENGDEISEVFMTTDIEKIRIFKKMMEEEFPSAEYKIMQVIDV